MRFRGLGILLVMLWGSTAVSAAPPLPCESANEYRAALNSVLQETQTETTSLKDVADSIPERCEFALDGHAFVISNRELQTQLRAAAQASPEERKGDLNSAREKVQRRLEDLDAYAHPVDPTAKTKLTAIMAKKEFRHVGSQSPRAYLQEQVMRLLERFFSFVFSNPTDVALAAKILAWTLCLLVGGFILWKVYRWLMKPAGPEMVREVIPFAPSAKNWRSWLKDAREAAANEAWREAVHSAYWAVISHLEAKGTWRPDKARTPREYMRLVSAGDPVRGPLRRITHDFEAIWYGNRATAASEWEAFIEKVESIGCR